METQLYASIVELSDKGAQVLDDQSTRGQVLKLSEKEAGSRFPNFVVASYVVVAPLSRCFLSSG